MAQTSIEFRVKYWTTWGQNLVVVGPDPRLGGWDVKKGVFMHCQVREGLSPGTDRSRHVFFLDDSSDSTFWRAKRISLVRFIYDKDAQQKK